MPEMINKGELVSKENRLLNKTIALIVLGSIVVPLVLLSLPKEERTAVIDEPEPSPYTATRSTAEKEITIQPDPGLAPIPEAVAPEPDIAQPLDPNKAWYEGGTLHAKTGRDWRAASYHNKLATCTDFIAMMWQKKKLEPSMQERIKSIEDIRPFANQLVAALNTTFTDKRVNNELDDVIGGQKISSCAVIYFVTMGWTQ